MELCEGLDLIDELRFRCWARENYREPQHRSAAWHPVILDEMHRRDAEAAQMAAPEMAIPAASDQRRIDGRRRLRSLLPHFSRETQGTAAENLEMHYF